MVTSELCHVLAKTLPHPPKTICCPLLYRMLINTVFCLETLSSCGEDMEASDAEVEEEILPPSKVITPKFSFSIENEFILYIVFIYFTN